MEWKDINIDGYPEEGSYVLIAYDFGVGIAQYVDGDWDTVGANRRHYIFTNKEKVYSSAHAQYWMPLPKPPK